MATYYKYAEREASNYINWTEIGKNLSDTLNEEAKRREELKDKLDQASSEFGQKLNNAPQGEFQTGNEWTIDASSKVMEMRLIQDQLLKTGKWNLRQYLSARRNLEGDTKGLYDLMTEYQTEYKNKLEAFKKQETSGATLDFMALQEGLANLQNTSFYINPTTGTGNLGIKKLNPQTGVYEMTNDFAPVQSLRNRIKLDIPKYKLDELKADVGTLGETTVSRLKDVPGFNRIIAVESETDPVKRKALIDEESKKDPLLGTYLSWEENMVNSKLSNPFKVTSILKDYVSPVSGKEYKPTLNEDEFKNDKTGLLYLLKDNGSGVLKPTFKPEQEQVAANFVRDQYRNMITQKTKIDVATEPDVWHPDAGYLQWKQSNDEEKKKLQNTLNMAAQLYYGDNTQINAAIQYFKGLNPSIAKMTRDKNGVTIYDSDGNKTVFGFSDKNGNVIPQKEWLQGVTGIHGIKDINSALQQTGFDTSKKFNYYGEGFAETSKKQSDAEIKWNAVVTKKTGEKGNEERDWDKNIYVEDNPELLAQRLGTATQGLGLGLTFEGTSEYGLNGKTDYLLIKKGNEVLKQVQVDDQNGSPIIQNFITDYIKATFPTETPRAETVIPPDVTSAGYWNPK